MRRVWIVVVHVVAAQFVDWRDPALTSSRRDPPPSKTSDASLRSRMNRSRRRPELVAANATSRRRAGFARQQPARKHGAASGKPGVAACTWCAGDEGRDESAARLQDWRATEPPCKWCSENPQHTWCEGIGGRGCDNGATRCAVPRAALAKWCRGGRVCSARCLHAIVVAPAACLEREQFSEQSKACARSPDDDSIFQKKKKHRTLVHFLHLQKTGGWSLVEYARRSGVPCPAAIQAGSKRGPGPVMSGCEAYGAMTGADENVLRTGSRVAQVGVLAAHSLAYGMIHMELPLSKTWPPFLGTANGEVLYVTMLREPIARCLSHFEMGTRHVTIPGVFSGEPLPGSSLADFASRPLTECRACLRAKATGGGKKRQFQQMSANKSLAKSVRGGGEFRHCCRKQWRYSADNYYTRELNGFANLVDMGFGDVTQAHLAEALTRLSAFDAVLITEELHLAPKILSKKLGWAVADAPLNLNKKIASKTPTSYDATAIAALRDRNRFDIELYAAAKEIWDKALRDEAR